jgi:hypothetical protein
MYVEDVRIEKERKERKKERKKGRSITHSFLTLVLDGDEWLWR